MGLGGGSDVSINGLKTSGTGSKSSLHSKSLGFASSVPTGDYNFAEDTNPELQDHSVPKPVKLDLTALGNYKPIKLKDQVEQNYRSGATQFASGIAPIDQKAIDDHEEKIINDKLEHYKKKYGDSFWGGVQGGVDETSRLVARGVSKGAFNLVKGLFTGADMIRRNVLGGADATAEEEKVNNDFLKKIDHSLSMGLDDNFSGTTSLSRATGSLAAFVPAMLSDEVTGGMSFAMDGLGTADKEIRQAEASGVKFKNGADDLYRVGKMTTNYILMNALNTHVLFKTLPAAVRNDLAGLATVNAMKGLAKSGEAITAESIANAMKSEAVSVAKKLPEFLSKGVKAYGNTALDLSALSYIDNELKKKANDVNGSEALEVQNPEQMANTLKKILTEDAPIFAGFGMRKDAGMLFSKSPYKNMVIEAVKADKSPDNLQRVIDGVTELGQKQGWSQDDIAKTVNQTKIVADAVSKLPERFTPKQFNEGVDLITGRNDMQEVLDIVKKNKPEVDVAFGENKTFEEVALENKIDQANDKLKELATGKKTKYLFDEEKGVYTKQIGEEKPVAITKERYELEQVEKDGKKERSTPPVEDVTVDNIVAQDTPKEASQETKPVVDVKVTVEEKQPFVQGELDLEPKQTFKEAVADKGIHYFNGENGEIREDGQTVVFETNDKVYELGNKDELSDKDISELGIEKEYPVSIKLKDDNSIEIDGKQYVNNFSKLESAINYDREGNVVSVNLETADGKKRTFRGQKAEEIAYQYKLKSFENEATEQQIDRAIESADKIIITESEVKPVDTKTKIASVEPTREQKVDNDKNVIPEIKTKKPETDEVKQPVPDKADMVKEDVPSEKPKEVIIKKESILSKDEDLRKKELRIKFSGRFNDITGVFLTVKDPEFREYAGLVYKEAKGDFKAFAKEMIDNVGEKIREHLPKLYEELSSNKETGPTGVSKAETKKQREYRGEEALLAKDKQTLQGMFDSGKEAVQNGLIDPRQLAADLAKKPRAITPDEINAMLFDRQRIKNELDSIYGFMDEATEKKDYDAVEQIRKRQLFLEHQRALNELAVQSGANTNALALASMRSMIEKDYSRSDQEARMRSKNGGKLTEEMREEIKRYSEELEEARAKLKDFEEKAKETLAKKRLLIEQKKQRLQTKAVDKDLNKKERATIVEDFLKEIAKVGNRMNSIEGATAGYLKSATPFMRKMVINLAREGIIEFKDVVSRIKEEFQEHIEGLTDRDVMDVLAGNYNEVKKTKNELIAQKNAIMQLAKLTTKLDDMIAGLAKETSGKKSREKRADIVALEKEIKRLEDIAGEETKEEKKKATYIKVLKKNIEDIESQISKGEKNKREDDKYEGDIDIEALRIERDQKRDELNKMGDENLTPEERLKKSLKGQIDRINEKIANGDFESSEIKPKPILDDELITLKARVRKAQNNFDAMAERLDRKSESKINRALDTYSDINRMFLLSGIKTLGKLYSFASQRIISTPIEEVFNTMNSKLTGLRKIAHQSPRFKGGFSPSAEAKAIMAKISKASFKDTWNILKTGASELDTIYGKAGVDKDFQLNPSAIEFFGRLHGAFKNTTKRAEFYRSYEKRLEFAAENGKDINDPNVQFSIGLEAYADGKRAILMHDNMLTDAYKTFLRTLEGREGRWEGKTVATFFRTLLPIIKIPTNYALEAFDTATGGIRATPYILKAAIKGADSLTPSQANMVMRSIAKGQFGLAMMTLAYFNPNVFGGYYSGKRDDKDLKAGDVVLNGVHLPHWMTHHPILEAMQIAATMRRAIDAANGYGSDKGIMESLTSKNRDAIIELAKAKQDNEVKEPQSVTVNYNGVDYGVNLNKGEAKSIVRQTGFRTGLKTSISGLSGQVPFFETPGQISEGLKSDNKLNKFEGDFLRNRLEPRLLQESADWSDKDTDVKFSDHPVDYMFSDAVKRDPKTILEHLKVGVPFLRQQVGVKAGNNVRLQQIKVGTDVYELNSEQVKEREKYVTEWINEFGADVAESLKDSGKTQKDIELYINNKALDYSKALMIENHSDDQTEKINLKLKNQ